MSLLAGAASGAEFGSLREVPRDLALSVRAQVAPEGLLILLASGASFIAINSDDAIQRTLQRHAPMGVRATDAGAILGNYAVLLPAAGAVYLAGGWTNATRIQEAGLMSLEALTVAGVETEALKLAVRRERPDGSDRLSFPSGHASASFSVATVLASEYGWTAGVPAFLAAGFVGYTRMEKNKHHLSDVLFGAGLGVSAGRAAFKTRHAGHPERFAAVPFVQPGGGGLLILF